jgi:thymidylate synthase
LTMIIAKITGYQPGEFIHTLGDAHIYQNHIDQVKEQIKREPKPFPQLKISDQVKSLDSFKPEHVSLENYQCHPPLKGDLTVAGGFDEKDRR